MKELYKKGLNDPENYDSVVIHLEQDMCEGSIALNKACEGDGIPAELFQIL